MRFASAMVAALAAAIVCGCATTTYRFRPDDNRVEIAVRGPLRDLGVMREAPPEILTRAVADPYALPHGLDCTANLAEIAELDQVLGPDLRIPGVSMEEEELIDPSGLVAGAISGAIGLPYSGIIRRLTGAAERDRILRGAILAGIVRRSFLRGVAYASWCLPKEPAELTSPSSEPVETPGAPKIPALASPIG